MSAWRSVPLGDVAEIERDIVGHEAIAHGTTYVGLENIVIGGDFSAVGEVSNGELKSAKFAFSADHVLYGKLRPYLAKIALPDFAGVCSTDILPLRPGPKLDRRFLAYFLRQPAMIELATTRSSGANLPRLSPSELASFEVPLPPIDEQHRIAAILDEADALRAKRRAALAQLDEMARAIFVEMFGDQAVIERGWPMRPLGTLLDFLTSGSRGWAAHYADNGDIFLRIQNVRCDELDLSDVANVKSPATAEARRTKVEPGDVLLSITADLGRTAVVPPSLGSAYINQHLAILRGTQLNPRFLSAYLASPSGQEQVQKRNRQGVKAGLNFDDIRSVSVPEAPRSLQDSFAARLASVDALRRHAQGGQHTLDSLFASLQHRAFRGEL